VILKSTETPANAPAATSHRDRPSSVQRISDQSPPVARKRLYHEGIAAG
jgi:hypothetical protein